MSDIKFSLAGPETVTLSVQTINKLIRCGDGDAALLYLYLLKTEGKRSSEQTMAAFGKGLGWINTTMATLSRIGLIHLDKSSAEASVSEIEPSLESPDAARHLTVADMRRELEAGSGFSIVVEEAQRSLGTILSPDDLIRLLGIYDHLNMPPEVILQLITYCINESKRTRGGRTPGMRYIEKVAYTWAREGILTLERAEEYIKDLEAKRSIYGEIKKVLQIRDREFSSSERKYVDGWIVLGYDASAVEIAYDRTILRTGRLSWNYLDSILHRWHTLGLHTVQEIIEKDRALSRDSRYSTNKNSGQKFGAPDQDEIKRMQRVLDKTKGN